jgi:uncharacterized membrane protein
MHKGRLEAFSDGVIAIIITIMVLEMKVPHESGGDLKALEPVKDVFLSYINSFMYLGIYWNNHHHLFQTVKLVKGSVLWANLHLLFWLSLIPFTSAWMGENHFALWPVVLYGIVLLGAGLAYFILAQTLIAVHGKDSVLSTAIGDDIKGKVSLILYLLGIFLAFIHPLISFFIYCVVAFIWVIPDRRIEKVLKSGE